MSAQMIDAEATPQLAVPDAILSPELSSILATYVTGPGGLKSAAKARGMYMYYRKPNGDIGTGLAFMTDMLRFMMEGWTPLTKYGYFKLGEYYQENQYEVLLQKGGAHEFTYEQANELRFHLNPPSIPGCGLTVGQAEPFMFQVDRGADEPTVGKLHRHDEICFESGTVAHFPQFDSGAPKVYACDFCSEEHTSLKGRNSHVHVMHKDQLASYATAQALTNAIKESQLAAS